MRDRKKTKKKKTKNKMCLKFKIEKNRKYQTEILDEI